MEKQLIQMVDLQTQYKRLQKEMMEAQQQVIDHGQFINGPEIRSFAEELSSYMNVDYVIPCGNGTDALQISLMALKLKPGDEVIVPAFTYFSAAEVVALMGLTPVVVDVEPDSFNLDVSKIEPMVSSHTKAIIVTHLFGQCADMEKLMKLAKKYKLYVIEDNAQSLGAECTFSDGTVKKAGTIGDLGTTSFFPTKPLACYGDGGALMTNNKELAERVRMISQHGQKIKYNHEIIGVNSRLDTLQAAFLRVKLRHLNEFNTLRQQAAQLYDEALDKKAGLITPVRNSYSTHLYHQYTLRIADGKRNELKAFLQSKQIPSMIYYPLPVNEQKAIHWLARTPGTSLNVSEELCSSVLSLPIHTEMDDRIIHYITETILQFFTK